MTNLKKVITHAGDFHADEVSAIALIACSNINKFGIMPSLERKFVVSQEELADPNILVIDIGRDYDITLGNLDHHQNPNSAASNILTLNYLVTNNYLDYEVGEELKKLFFNRISDIDIGKEKATTWEFSSLIKQCPDWNEALNLSIKIISNMVTNIIKGFDDRKEFKKLHKERGVVFNQSSKTILNWKELAAQEGINFLVCPNERGGWNLISRDSELFNIPEDSNQTFRHNSGFLAVYPTVAEATIVGIELNDYYTLRDESKLNSLENQTAEC